MDGSPMLFHLPPVRSTSRSTAIGTTRKQPIRDSIMAYLTETRSAKQIAEHIDRKVSIATGHLRAMRVRGLVVRVGWGRYIRTDRCDAPPDPTTITRANSTKDLVRRFAPEAQSLEQLQTLTGRAGPRLIEAARLLRAAGYEVPEGATTPA